MEVPASSVAGCVHPNGTWKASGSAAMSSYSSSVGHKNFGSTTVILRTLPSYRPRNMSITCSESPNNHRRILDLSRQRKESSRGNWQSKERESDPLPTKNGSLLSLSASNQRFSAVATPGKKEREIVELFKKVQIQLRERATVNEEKKMEATQQAQQQERATVDSLLRLLRRHTMTQGRKSSDSSEDEPDSSFESDTVPTTRPISKFQRRSPVPCVKFKPVSSPEAVKKMDSSNDRDHEAEKESNSDTEIGNEHVEEASIVESSDLASLKLVELRGLAKSQGIKGYSKLKKGELLEILSRDCA